MRKTRSTGVRPALLFARAAAFVAASGLALVLLLGARAPRASYGHGTVDQEFAGPFTLSPPLTNALSQSFTPSQAALVAIDLFLSTDDANVESATAITVTIVELGDWSSVLGSATATAPANTRSTDASPFVLHLDFASTVTLTAETRYVMRLGSAETYQWAAQSSNPYTRGNAYVGSTSLDVYDFGFRTYYAPAPPSDTTPPVITYDLDPDLPANAWYRSDVTLDWTVTEAESSAVLDGCEDVTVEADQDITEFTCSATSAGGSSGPVTVEFGRDTVAPTIEAAVTAGTLSNGWYRSDVIVGFTCADGRSGIAPDACPDPQTLSDEGASVSSVARTVFDRAGDESAASNVVTVKIDKTGPAVTITPDRAPDVGDAYDHEVTFTATGDDGTGSGVASCDEPEAYDGPVSEDASVTMSCSDLAGNVGSATYHFAFVEPSDETQPTISASIWSGTKGNGDWYVSDVVVRFACDDEDSGIPEGNCPPDQTLSAEGVAVSSTAETVLDGAGNESDPSNVITVSIDKTKPSAQASALPAPNEAGWNSTAVTVTFTGSDSGSGLAGCDAPTVLSGDGAGQSATGSCSDVAGNTRSASAMNINIDRTKPSVTISASRTPDSGTDAYDHAVTFTASGDDGSGSGIAHCDAPETYSGPLSSAATVEMSCADNAGNVGTASVTFRYIDSTPPAIAFVLSPSLPAGGWYASDVTLTWSVVEAESPGTLVTAGCVNQHATSDRAYAMYSCSASSAGGQTSTVEVEFGRDATKPLLTSSVAGTAGAGGWFTSDVTIAFSCTDAGSGVASDSVPDVTVTTEGASQSVTSTGACVDHAGNVADAVTVSGIKVDKTPPTASLAVVSGTLGSNGWYVSNVVARTSGADDVSGPVSCTADQTLSADSGSHTFEGACTNAAGLETDAEALTVKLDRTAPSLSPSLSSTSVEQGGSLTVAANATDATSGVATSSCGSLDTGVVGSHSVSCTATDRAGNVATASIEYQVLSGGGVIVYGFRPPSGGGYGTFSFGGGTFEELLTATGCPRSTSVFFFNKQDGRFAVWIPGALVGAVNEEFLALFGGTPPLPDGSIFTARCV